MRKLGRALVPLEKQEGGEDRFQEPFLQFVTGLYGERADAATTMAGSARWSAFPIEHAIADGLWPVLLRVAEKVGHTMVTERQVVEDIAPRVNHLVNAGLALVYPSIDVACAAFAREVIGPVYAASRGMSGSDSGMLQAVWQRPVAKFFATLIKTAQDYGDEIGRTLALIYHENSADEDRDITFIDSGVLLKFNWLQPFLQLEGNQVASPPKAWGDPYQFLRDASRELDQLRARQVALKSLPLRLSTLPNDMTSFVASVDYPWIRTQLLLAAADLPDREHVLGNEFTQATQAVVTRDEDVIIASFFQRMTTRGMTVDAAAREHLDAMARDALATLKPGLARKTTLDLELLSSLFMMIRPEHLTFDRDTALRVALGTERITDGLLEPMSEAAREKYWRTHVMPVIVWKTLTVDDMHDMVSNGPIPLPVLAEGIAKMNVKERKQAVEWLLQSNVLSKSIVAYWIEQGVIRPTADFLALHYRKVPEKLLGRYLPELLQEMDGETSAATVLSPSLVLSLFACVSDRVARAIVDDPTVREPLVKHVITEIVDPDYRASRGITKADHAQFVTQIGADRWYRLALFVEISIREEEYVRGSEQGAGETTPRWDNLLGRLASLHNLPKWLGLSGKRAQHILRAYAEDDVFSWLYAGREDLPERLATYRAARKRYYK